MLKFADNMIHCGRYVDLFLSFRHC